MLNCQSYTSENAFGFYLFASFFFITHLSLNLRASCNLDIEAYADLMRQMREAKLLRASRTILSYVVPSASDLVKQIRNKIFATGMAVANDNVCEDDIEILEILGEGTFGKVRIWHFRGIDLIFITTCPTRLLILTVLISSQVSLGHWRGTFVAVKSMMLPTNGTERHETMAIMEAVISSALSHPNIVQVCS